MTHVKSKYPSKCSYRGQLFAKTLCIRKNGELKHEAFYKCMLKDETIMCKRKIKDSNNDSFCFVNGEE